MKKLFLLVVVIIVISVPMWAIAGPYLFKTEGYVSGQLSAVSRDKNITRAYVGEISMGNESMSFFGVGNQPPNLVSNPWRFCFEKDHYEEIENLIGRDVVLEFTTPKKNSLLSCASVNELKAVYPISQHQPMEQKHFIGDIRTLDREIAYGVEYGRITNVIKNKGEMRSYFMTMQVGNGGNKFRHFLIDDSELYDFAVTVLKNAAMVRVHYSDRLTNSSGFYGFRSRSMVAEIEIVEDASSKQ